MHFTLIDGERAWEGEVVTADGALRIPAAELPAALGFELRPEGLCRGALCVPTRGHEGLATEKGVDLERLAALLDRPLAIDRQACAAALGESAAVQRERLESLEAPDFALPDLTGRVHRLSDHRGKKVLLHAFASW